MLLPSHIIDRRFSCQPVSLTSMDCSAHTLRGQEAEPEPTPRTLLLPNPVIGGNKAVSQPRQEGTEDLSVLIGRLTTFICD